MLSSHVNFQCISGLTYKVEFLVFFKKSMFRKITRKQHLGASGRVKLGNFFDAFSFVTLF